MEGQQSENCKHSKHGQRWIGPPSLHRPDAPTGRDNCNLKIVAYTGRVKGARLSEEKPGSVEHGGEWGLVEKEICIWDLPVPNPPGICQQVAIVCWMVTVIPQQQNEGQTDAEVKKKNQVRPFHKKSHRPLQACALSNKKTLQ